jgi:hypothetical protein
MIYSADWTHDPQLFVHAQANIKMGKCFRLYKRKIAVYIVSSCRDYGVAHMFPSQLSVTERKKEITKFEWE